MARRRKRSSTPAWPKRDCLAPTTAMQSRIAIFSPTDREVPLPPGGQVIATSQYGHAEIEGYRPTRGDKLIIEAVIALGKHAQPSRDTSGKLRGGVFHVDPKQVAHLIGKRKHVDWVMGRLSRIGKAQVKLYDASGSMIAFYHMIAEAEKTEDGYYDVVFTSGYLETWLHDTQIFCEQIVGMLAEIESPVVGMLVERSLTQEYYREGLDKAMKGVGALSASARKQRERYADVRKAGETFARFGIRLYRSQKTGEEVLERDENVLKAFGLVQITPQRA